MHFVWLQWKETFRASQWETKLSIKIIIALVSIYFIGAFTFMASMAYPAVFKLVKTREPLEVINSALLFVFLLGLFFRFFFQQLPVTNIQSLILLPFRKAQIIHHTLLKSIFSGFNLAPLIVYLPIAISMYKDDYLPAEVGAWWASLTMITLCLNWLIFLINKSNLFFGITAVFGATIVASSYFEWFDLSLWVGAIFDDLVLHPSKVVFFVFPLLITYVAVFFFLKKQFYLDKGLAPKREKVSNFSLSFIDVFGKNALFLKNDLRLIWRNARPKQIVLVSFLFLFYGLVFFPQEIYRNQPAIMAFAGLFVTGGFTMTFGNYVPAWDSSYYKLLMSQNISYKEYLLSKWNLMTFVTLFSSVLATPYIYFGWEILFLIWAGSLFTVGLGTWITLFGGLLNKTPMKLNVKAKAFENTQAFSITQFALTLPKMGLPVLFYAVPASFYSPWVGTLVLGLSGVIGILFKNKIAKWVTRLYKKQKHETLAAFNQ